MRTFQVSQFKSRCLGLLKQVRDGGEPIAVTLRGKTLAVVQAQGAGGLEGGRTVAETLERLRPLLRLEDDEFEARTRTNRPSADEPLQED